MLTIILWFLYWFKWIPGTHIVKGFAIFSIVAFADWVNYWLYLEYWFSNYMIYMGKIPTSSFFVKCVKTIITVIFG
jgi:hypothetical protein